MCPSGAVLNSCLALRLHERSLSGASVHGTLRARTLEWISVPSTRGSSRSGIEPVSPTLQAGSLPMGHLGSPKSPPVLFYIFTDLLDQAVWLNLLNLTLAWLRGDIQNICNLGQRTLGDSESTRKVLRG